MENIINCIILGCSPDAEHVWRKRHCMSIAVKIFKIKKKKSPISTLSMENKCHIYREKVINCYKNSQNGKLIIFFL